MDAAARRAKPNRGRPLVPPNYVSLRDLRELRLKEKEEQRRREEEEAAARRVREDQRKRQEEEEEAAARRFVEERRRREEEEKARRARAAAAAPAPAPAPEMRASSSTSSFRSNERARGGQRLVVVADRPPPRREEVTALKIDVRGNKGPDGGPANAPPGGGFKAQVSAGPGEPAKPAAASSRAGKPEEKRKGEASGIQGTAPGTNSAPGELVDIASYRGPGRPRHRHQGRKKGLDGRSTETAMTSSIGEAVEASSLPVVNQESKGKSRPGDRSNETAPASIPGKAAEASPPRGVKSDNKRKEKPSGGRQASTAPGSDMPDGKKVEASVSEGTASGVSSVSSEHADADVASCRLPLKPMYRRKGKKGFDARSVETATTNVAGKTTDTSSFGGVNLEIKGNKGLTEQGTETALPMMSSKAADASLARGFKSENKLRNEPSAGRHAGMPPSTACRDGMKTQPCPAAVGSGSQRSSGGGQGTTWEAKTEGLQGKQRAEEVKAQSHPAAESSGYLRSSSDQGMIQAAKPEGSGEKQRVVEMRTASQLKPRNMRNSGRQWPGDHSRVNFAARQNSMVWMPKAAAAPDCAEVGNFP
ncbi:uncharacterized protein [Lolium perenne]|uniref:uncharacterized protein n=1 Tax=Lolium perenne TaxID=4522 RepID=UPI0021EAE85B|nr:stress response protein NST1-like [Lolium perenne]